jgi:hypothetical protein
MSRSDEQAPGDCRSRCHVMERGWTGAGASPERTNSLRRYRRVIWAIAAPRSSMWSVAVLAPAYPRRSVSDSLRRAFVLGHRLRGFDQVGCVYTTQGFEYGQVRRHHRPDLVARDGPSSKADSSGPEAVRRHRCQRRLKTNPLATGWVPVNVATMVGSARLAARRTVRLVCGR